MTVFFTSDTHFGHANILKKSARGFFWPTVEEMDEGLIERWNRKVTPKDTVYHLGDFSWRPKETTTLLERLNGKVHLITGNHDPQATRFSPGFESVHPLLTLKGLHPLPITLCHYGMRVWNQSHHGALHFYGHSHGSLPGTSQSCDVGVDVPCWGYAPVSLEELQDYLRTLPPHNQEDYHRADRH